MPGDYNYEFWTITLNLIQLLIQSKLKVYIFNFNQEEVPCYSSIEDDIISYIGGYSIRKLSLKLCSFCCGILRSNNLSAKYCFIDNNIEKSFFIIYYKWINMHNHIYIYKKDGYKKII